MALFEAVEKSFLELHGTPRLHDAFDSWRTESDGLGAFTDVDDFVAACRPFVGVDDDLLDGALATLCRKATSAGNGAPVGCDVAACLLLYALLPNLKVVADRPGARTALERDDVEAQIAAGIWEQVVSLVPGHGRVARRLINAARRSLHGSVKDAIRHERLSRALLSRQPAFDVLQLPEDGLLAEACARGLLTQFEADLILRTRVHGWDLADFARASGLSWKSAEHRRARAEARLVAWLAGDPVPTRWRAGARRTNLFTAGLAGPDGDEDKLALKSAKGGGFPSVRGRALLKARPSLVLAPEGASS